MIEYIIKLKRKTRNIFQDRWVWTMAWRDARQNFSRLFLFAASLITGIAAVVSLDSLNESLQQDIDRNAKELLGADLVVNGNKKFEPELLALFDSTKFPQAREADMASMVLFVNSGQSRLIRLVSLEGDFPFYGSIETLPPDAYQKMRHEGFALLDETLASQYEVSSGDSIRIGNSYFEVAGVVTKIPGGGGILSTFTPSVYIAMAQLDSTGLVQYGSRINYRNYFKTESEAQTELLVTTLKTEVRKYGHGYDTVQERKEELGEAFQSVYRFFSLLAFVALILGCIGVASSVHIYAREKRDEVAVLRCVGSSGWQAFNIYFIQIFLLGIIGSLIGASLGLTIQQIIPVAFKGLLPVEVTFSVSWLSFWKGIMVGTVVSLLFSMLPLMAVRFVPPLAVLRADFEPTKIFSKARLFIIILIALFPLVFAALQTRNLLIGLSFFAGLAVALGALTLMAILLLYLVRRFFPSNSSFIWRHALSNLYRPNNQTRVLMVAIGLGAFIITTLNIVEKSLLGQVEFSGQKNQSNTILFDIQPSQKDGVVKLMEENNLTVNQVVPIVTCRLKELKNKTVEEVQQDTTDRVPNWALTREYRVTYRDSLHLSEELIRGDLQHKTLGRDSVWVTISEGLHEELGVREGDSLVFDVQGIPVKVFISGIRKVNWPKDPPNFIFVFPTGVLEEAPQVYVTATRIDDQQAANRFQQQLIMQYPNVSLIDLRLILSTVNDLFNKLGAVIRFLALFSIVTGLVVLTGAVINSKYVRMKENVLLRTIGARTKQIIKITLIEYAYLGLFSALTGMLLSLGGGYLLTTFFFKITFAFNGLEVVTITGGVVLLTMVIGWWNSREVIATPPLQVLRKEG
ncbi:MAG: FtsX-like permease family protein [Cyclobacteriaceae bacterium]|nr:FtsX-like permease family protein [Cyclobacteriaceae bacterium]UYN85713.1 MAG: FtsX-like permease family protein [Cyclobacteriaceae bacterium]